MTEIAVLSRAKITLVCKPVTSRSLAQKREYHFVENAGGGKCPRYSRASKDIINVLAIGTNRRRIVAVSIMATKISPILSTSERLNMGPYRDASSLLSIVLRT